jgi:hypothetical protein
MSIYHDIYHLGDRNRRFVKFKNIHSTVHISASQYINWPFSNDWNYLQSVDVIEAIPESEEDWRRNLGRI